MEGLFALAASVINFFPTIIGFCTVLFSAKLLLTASAAEFVFVSVFSFVEPVPLVCNYLPRDSADVLLGIYTPY